jgi:coproporphyrinogen III oxidase-like Fe-S oxidoreductase
VQFELLEGVGHGGPAFSSPENLEKIFKFLDKYLKDNNPGK